MADKQFIKGAVTGVLCASLVLGGGYVGLQKAGRAGSTVLSDVAVTQKIKYLEDIIDQNYLEDVDEDSLNAPARTPFIFLALSGVVMIVALTTSRKAYYHSSPYKFHPVSS